jgi:hypothetical protein
MHNSLMETISFDAADMAPGSEVTVEVSDVITVCLVVHCSISFHVCCSNRCDPR